MNLALFDFDGTLTTKDSLGEFIRYVVGTPKYILGMIQFSPLYIAYRIKLLRNDIAKEKLFEQFFKDYNETEFKTIAKKYSMQEIDLILRKPIYEKFLQHIENGDRVIIVSASMRCWLEDWAKKHNVELLSTQLEFKNKKVTGKFFTKNCHGEEKVNRIKKHLLLDDYDTIYAYGDSSGDDAMLKIAHHKTRV